MGKGKASTASVGKAPAIRETTLGELGHFLRGKGIPRADLAKQGLPCLRYGEIYTTYNNYVEDLQSRVKPEAAHRAVELLPDDIVFTSDGETAEEIGKAVAYVGKETAFVGDHSIILRDHGQDSVFLAHLLNSHGLRKQKARLGKGASIVGIRPTDLAGVRVLLPPTPDQRKIADIFRTWDGACIKLTAYRKAKERRYAGLVHRVFQWGGKVPNASDEPLVNVARLVKGEQLNSLDIIQGEYPVWNGGTSPSGFHNAWNTRGNTITISEGGASCGFCNYEVRDFWLGGHCYALKDLSSLISRDFLFHFLKAKEMSIMNLRVGTGLPNIQRGSLERFRISFPPLPEQNRISEALSAGRKELDLIQAKASALETQKHGVMQKLLNEVQSISAAHV